MIEQLLSVIDRLVQLKEHRAKRRVELFTSIFEPIFCELQLVHTDYIQMFQHVLTMLVNKKTAGHRLRREKAVEQLLVARIELEPLRAKVRHIVHELSGKNYKKEEMQFIDAMMAYFPSGCLTTGTAASDLADRIAAVDEKEDPANAARTIAEKIKSLEAAEAVALTVGRTKKRWDKVCEAFARLRVIVHC